MVVKMVLVGECMCLCKRMRIMKIFVIKVKKIRKGEMNLFIKNV